MDPDRGRWGRMGRQRLEKGKERMTQKRIWICMQKIGKKSGKEEKSEEEGLRK